MANTVLKDKNGNGITWLEAIIRTFKILGHPARVEDIYDCMLDNVISEAPIAAKTPAQTIREKIFRHSHDSKSGIGNEHIFYKTETGVWGLVDNELSDIEVGMSDDDSAFPEGKAILQKHLHRERSRTLVNEAKKRFAETHNGKLYCEACGFDFSKVYGDIGKNFIEAHHMKSVSEMQEGEKTKIDDLAMLCSNCHRMVHKTRPWISNKQDLHKIIKDSEENNS